MARPHGEITLALLAAAAAGPCTINELGRRALVGRAATTMTASRMIQRGQLQRVGAGRPAVVALPIATDTKDPASGAELAAALTVWR